MPGSGGEASGAGAAGRVPWRRVVGYVVGLALLAGALWVVLRHREVLAAAVEAAQRAPWWLVAAVVVLPLANWLTISLSFWVLTRAWGRVSLGEMCALVASAWLLNHLPMRPGLFVRVAYLKGVCGIRLRDTAVIVAIGAASGVGVTAPVVLILAALLPEPGVGALAWLLCVPAALLGLASGVSALRPVGSGEGLVGRVLGWRVWMSVLIRYADLLVWAVRYMVLFEVTGASVGLAGALAIACASQIAMLAPVPIGLREWAVGLTAALMPAGLGGWGVSEVEAAGGVVAAAAPGILADVVNRGAELACATPLGLAASAWLYRRVDAAAENSPTV